MSFDELSDGHRNVVACDLCIVGAGVAGLNALFAASRHLAPRDKVVLIDRSPGVGGMWTRTYDYVRLHQPHQMFTAGNIAWTFGKERSYLATRPEVVAHLAHCLETLKKRVTVEEYFGYEYLGHEESSDLVHIHFAPAARNAQPLVIHAKKCVKAFGNNVQQNQPLPISSTFVRSVSPDLHDLTGHDMRCSDAPVYIIGGGKTGMDTAHTLLTHFPGKRIHLVVGVGTMFADRGKIFPVGARRWWAASTSLDAFLDCAARFDGTNERDFADHFRTNYGISLNDRCQRFMFGLLSAAENAAIKNGTAEVIMDYLSDVVDRDGEPTMLFRSGAHRRIEPGSVVVNASGYLFKEGQEYEPYVSENGNVVSIQTTSAVNYLSTVAAYFLVHLLYLDKLKSVPLYELDIPDLNRKAKEALAPTMATHTLHNAVLLIGAVPKTVTDEFGIDIDRWHPSYRRLMSLLKLALFLRRRPNHFQRSLDRVRERFDVRCGTLPHVA